MTPESDLPASSVEMRRRVLVLVEEYPGLHLREIQRRMDTSAMLAEYHLNALEKLGLVVSEEHGGYRNFFPARRAGMNLDETDKRWLSLLRRPVVLGMALSLLETGPTRPIQLARALELPPSTAMYQINIVRHAGLVVQGEGEKAAQIRLADPTRVVELLRAYHPVPDALTRFAELWAKAIQAMQPLPAAPAGPVQPPASPQALPDAVAHASQRVQAVFRALQNGPLTSKDIQLETGLARRTVYSALQDLRLMGLIVEKPHLPDMRQTRFGLAHAPADDADGQP
jgi:predicted transcriptional regulator